MYDDSDQFSCRPPARVKATLCMAEAETAAKVSLAMRKMLGVFLEERYDRYIQLLIFWFFVLINCAPAPRKKGITRHQSLTRSQRMGNRRGTGHFQSSRQRDFIDQFCHH